MEIWSLRINCDMKVLYNDNYPKLGFLDNFLSLRWSLSSAVAPQTGVLTFHTALDRHEDPRQGSYPSLHHHFRDSDTIYHDVEVRRLLAVLALNKTLF